MKINLLNQIWDSIQFYPSKSLEDSYCWWYNYIESSTPELDDIARLEDNIQEMISSNYSDISGWSNLKTVKTNQFYPKNIEEIWQISTVNKTIK